MKMIDPPSGWKYDFPKPIPDNVTDVLTWLVENGYPKYLIDELGDDFACRYWYTTDDKLVSNSNQQEISDEEIEQAADKYVSEDEFNRLLKDFEEGAKWYREQLRKSS
jgi:hypothetical protein